jgi:phosphoribosyl 1,2-cyclic phosphate phosphodiesterase
LKVTFLGTGTSQGIPVIACQCRVCRSNDQRDKRLRTSALVEIDGKTIVIDSGPDFRQQMLRAGVRDINAILLTHEHKDHIAGMDDVRAFNFILGKPTDIYAEKRVQEAIKREYAYVFTEYKYPGVPQMILHPIDDSPFEVDGIKVIPIRVYHYKLPVYGFRIENFTYITDAKYLPEKEIEKIKGSEYLVINALRKRKHISHYNLDEAIRLINYISPEKAFITHISHQMGLHSEIEKELPPGITLAYDTLTVEC